MKKLLLIVASFALGGLVWAASNSACITNLIPPTASVQVCQDGSGQMNLQDATAGPVTLSGLNAWQTYIANSGGGVTISTNAIVSGTLSVSKTSTFSDTVTANKGISASTLSVTGVSTFGGTVTANLGISASTLTVTGIVSQSTTTFTGYSVLWGQTLAQLQAMTPAVVGELFYCTNCASTPVCISTGAAAAYQFAGVSVSTSATTGLGACK